MSEKIEIGTVSSRGQICIPQCIREEMGINNGTRIVFMLDEDVLFMRKVSTETFASLTKPLRKAKKKIKEEEVAELIHWIRDDKSNS